MKPIDKIKVVSVERQRSGKWFVDAVGPEKTIEAGLAIAHKWAEYKRHILIIRPANLRKQRRVELEETFFCRIRLSKMRISNLNGIRFDNGTVSLFAAAGRRPNLFPRSLTGPVIDGAHRLRKVYRPDIHKLI